MTKLYVEGQYWEQNPSFHEEDSEFKAGRCLTLLASAGVLKEPLRVLDVGCGSGAFLAGLSRSLSGDFTGIDISPQAIARAQATQTAPNRRYLQGDVSQFDEPFDLTVSNDVFEHVDDYFGFLRKLRPTAKLFYFNIPLDMTALGVARNDCMTHRRTLGHIHYFSKDTALATLQHAGFEVVAWQYNVLFVRSFGSRPTLKKLLAMAPRWLAYKVWPDLAVRVLGGASMGVVCRAA